MDLKYLKNSYAARKSEISKRLHDFKKPKNDEELFAELAFCLLTPQSRAKLCWSAVEKLKEKRLLHSDRSSIIPLLSCVRFSNNKAGYIEEAQKKFDELKQLLKQSRNPEELREWLVENIKGYGYKEASHFLRNIGFVDFAILDRHILKNLLKYKVINEIPKSLTKKRYLEIEEKMKKFSTKSGIPLSHLDLLFWSNETGEVFK
jgi:N-glycosylase/DNA lyase